MLSSAVVDVQRGRSIPLSKGYSAIVDEADYDRVSVHRWQAIKARNGCVYAHRTTYVMRSGKLAKTTEQMARFILGAPSNVLVDHRDGNTLDNRRHNLRECSRSQNTGNSRKPRGASSRFKGVTWDRKKSRWRAQIGKEGRLYRLGRYVIEEDAALAYDGAARRLFGEFACLNFPREGERSCLGEGQING